MEPIFRSRAVTNRRNIFLKNLINTTISDFFDIGQTNTLNFTYETSSNDFIDIFTVKYINEHTKIFFQSLPDDINYVINSYLCFHIDLKFNIAYPLNYPMRLPIWNLTHIDHNIHFTIDLNLQKYYRKIVDNHNNSYNNSSQTQTIDADILNFIVKINHFDYIEQYTDKTIIIV